MTTHKTFKRRVRARSEKTGESYTAARAQLLRKSSASGERPEPIDDAELTGMSREAMQRGSGRAIGEWIRLLDAWGASERRHPEIARWLTAEHGVGGWWAQSITVAYERARGKRATNRRPDGYTAGVNKTMDVPAGPILSAFTDATLRERWLADAPMRQRTVLPGRSARFDWDDPPSRLMVALTPKGEAKTQVTVQLEKVPDAESLERLRSLWRERLAALKESLERA